MAAYRLGLLNPAVLRSMSFDNQSKTNRCITEYTRVDSNVLADTVFRQEFLAFGSLLGCY